MKKSLSVILALVLLLALLPAAALAGSAYNLGNQVYLELKRDFSGSLPEGETLWTAEDFDNVPSDFAFQANWYLNGQLQPAGSRFRAGYTYELRLVMDSNAGSYSAIFENDGWAVLLGGGEFAAEANVTSERHAEASFYFSCRTTIGELSITNIELPLAGGAMQTAGFAFGPAAGMKLKDARWYCTSNTAVPIPVSGSFEAGKSYRLELTVGAPAGVNGKIFHLTKADVAAEAGTVYSLVQNSDSEVTVSIDFEVPASNKVSSVAVSIPAPAAGEYASFIASVSGVGYGVDEQFYDDGVIAGISWREGTEPLPKGSRFEAGKRYELIVYLVPEPGYEFISGNPNGYSDEVSARINGNTAESWGTETSLRVSYTFPALPEAKTEIDGLSVTVTKPVAGASPVYSAVPGLGGKYSVDTGWAADGVSNGVGWALMNSKTWDDIDRAMKPADKFEAGEIYMACVAVKPDSGYAFAASLTTDPSKVLVNGYAASHVSKNGDGLIVYYVYPPTATTKEITDVAVTLTAPKAGEKASFSANAATGADYTVKSVFWFCDEDNAALKSGDAFAAGKTYILEVTLAAKDGAAFGNDSVLKGTVNGESAQIRNIDGGALITKYFTLGKDKEITSVAVTLSVPKVGEKVSLAAAVPDDAKYAVKSVQVFCDEKNADMKDGETYENRTYILNVTLTPAEGYSFAHDSILKGTINGESAQTRNVEGGVLITKYYMLGGVNPFTDVKESDYFYDAVVWAYYAEPQVTNGIGNSLFGPDNTVKRCEAMTFLWRAVGCPEPKTSNNPFEDVTENDYYFKPVLWAVEKGITKGTDDTHFTPEQTCSTAHIITFLYRTLGIGDDGWGDVSAAWAEGAGLLEGLDITVAPGVDCPRRDVVLFLYRAVGK